MTAKNQHTDILNPEVEDLLIEIRADIAAVKDNISLYDPINFNSRADAIDFIDFHVIDRIESILPASNLINQLTSLKGSAYHLKLQLEQINERLFKKLRADVKTGNCRGEAFQEMVIEYFGHILDNDQKSRKAGYDNLDAFINSLLLTRPLPDETLERTPEMVFYQQTPARVIFELAEKADFKTDDVFYDIGSGLGHVSILVNLLCGVKANGLEFEPVYCKYATALAAEFNLTDVQFINQDARESDYADGTVFFMYTPFEGKMLEDVLERLRIVSEATSIKLFSYGPCTLEVTRQDWLNREDHDEIDIHKLAVFKS